RQAVARAMAREDVDALLLRFGHLLHFGHLWERRLFMEAAVVHVAWLARLVPPDLLDTVIELVGVTVRVVHIDVPVAPRHVAADALDADLLLLEIAVRVDDLL